MENNNKKKVMSDEQIETLRMQIASFNSISFMLAGSHNRRLTFHPPLPDLPLPEVEVENTQQEEPLTLHGGQRRRWTPTREQIEILESLFKDGEGSHPNKEKIKEITTVLSQHGQVSDANVYNWFQYRHARLRKKMHDQNKQMMMKKTYRFDHDHKLVSTTTYSFYNNDDDDNDQEEPLTLHGGQRRRWTPTREHIEILESLFKEGEGSHPNKEKIKEITAVLSQHGQVSDANVYNWFRSRCARLKKKMHDQNKQMMKKKTYRFDHDKLVSTTTYCFYNNDDNDQVESMS
ncbi:hypothetical protein K1719_000283 [Acacia pycnantha]|nr:hypothetical protein K1719_000283 [Acacia pycnantha]